MAKVPKYQQDKLASSLVGTPGVDTSGQEAFNQVATAAQGVANKAFSVLEADYREQQAELHRRQAEARAQAKQLETARRETDVAKYISGANVRLNKADNDARLKYPQQPELAQAELIKSAQLELDQAKNIPDELTRLGIEKGLNERIATYSTQQGDWALNQQVQAAKANVEQIGADFALSISDSTLQTGQVGTQLAMFDKNEQAYYNVYGPKAKEMMRLDKEEGIRRYLADTAEKHPELLEARLNSFDTWLDPKKKHEFISEVRRTAAEIERTRQFNERMTIRSNTIALGTELASASPTGRPQDAPPDVIRKIKEDPRFKTLPPEAQIRITGAGQAAQKKFQEAADDKTVITQMGTLVNHLDNSLYPDAQRKFQKAAKTRNKADIAAAEAAIDRYEATWHTVNQLQKSVTSPEAKQAMGQYVVRTKNQLDQLSKHIVGHPDAQKAFQIKGQFRQAVGRPPQVYTNPKQQKLFNFWYNAYQEDAFNEASQTGKLKKVLTDSQEAARIQAVIKGKTLRQMHKVGIK